MTDLASKPFEKVIEYLLDATIRQLDYIIFCNSHVKELKPLVEILKINKQLVESKVDLAKNNARQITPAVEHWLTRVDEKIKESEEFHCHKALSFKTGCSSGALPFLWYRRKLGRRAKKMLAPEIKDLNLECASTVLPNISCPQEAPSYAESNPSDGGYLEFKSRKDIIDKIMGHLKDTRVRMVGLYGPSGVGKTSLVKQIGKLAYDSRLFEKVVIAIVKKDPDHQKIQQDIADYLGLTFENEGEFGRATRLRKRLKQENTLVILDDLWDVLDLKKIGIPFYDDDVSSNVAVKDRNEGGETDIGGKKVKNEDSSGTTKGCKILVTSRQRDVLCNKMNAKENLAFLVPELYVDEAFTLFKKEVGMSNENFKFKPETLMKYCAGLPMAVIIVGRSLMNKRESEWEGELERLKSQESNEVHKYMENHVKLGILKDVNTLRDARKSISESIQKLKVSGLMLDSNSNDHFNMHDIVRDAALSIACKNQNAFILMNKTLNEWPDEEELEKCRAISIYKSHIVDELPEVVNCPHLRFFHIDNDDPTLKIPDSLSRSRIEDWPAVLGGLSKLQLLDISDCSISSSTGPLSLSSFTNLEEFYVSNSLAKMEVKGQIYNSQHSILSELKHLHQLNTMEVCIPGTEFLPTDLFFHELNDYKIVIGDFETLSIGDFKMPHRYEASRSLALQLEPGMDDIHSLKGIKLLLGIRGIYVVKLTTKEMRRMELTHNILRGKPFEG
ncbi:hypothetical protein PIB30_082034 [Stylosanthes scabra]|uniref:AAA+ ATPase domain-containing protein n=1 Tax=Stylosanthes scabra TaxID=79078 RepID=A0ABU6XUG5_9FABA|nr:hypothetical protein [Stylosanthes scabra]